MIKQVSGKENNFWLDRADLPSDRNFMIEIKKGILAGAKIVVEYNTHHL